MLLLKCLRLSSAEVAFPEFTVCPDFNGMTYNWVTLCAVYNSCNAQSFQNGNIFPNSHNLPTSTISDYFKHISHNIEDLVSSVELATTNNIEDTNNT